MPTFAELLRKYIERAGITDAELSRSIGVRRQTIFRWKEGIVARPRHRDDVISLSKRLRLSDEERDELLIVAGFAPESMPTVYPSATDESDATVEDAARDLAGDVAEDPAEDVALAAESEAAPVTIRLDEPDKEDTVEHSDSADLSQNGSVSRSIWSKLVPIGAILLLVGAIGYWLMGGVEPQEETGPPLVLTVPNTTPTTAPTTAPTPTRSEPPTPEAAAEDETLLLIVLFQNYTGSGGYNVAGRIEKELAEQIDSAGLKGDVRADILYRAILDEADAKNTLAEYKAALLIWGEYDSGRVIVNLTTRASNKTDERETQLPSPAELSPTINTNVPNETRILALIALGEHFLAVGENTKARTALEKVIALDPPADMQKKLYFQLGRAYAATPSNYEKSIDAYNTVLELSPRTANANYNRGRVYYERFANVSADPADLDHAIEDYSRMIKLVPSHMNAYLNRGIAYYSRRGEGDLEAAQADLTVVVDKGPESYLAFYNRGLLDISINDAEQWEPDLLRAKELAEPESIDYVNTLVALCWGYMLEKEFDSAQSNCEEALEISPDRGDSRDSMGIVHALNGDFDAAIEQFDLYIAWLKERPETYYERYNGPMVEEWITQLKAGEQPITDEVLESLRG